MRACTKSVAEQCLDLGRVSPPLAYTGRSVSLAFGSARGQWAQRVGAGRRISDDLEAHSAERGPVSSQNARWHGLRTTSQFPFLFVAFAPTAYLLTSPNPAAGWLNSCTVFSTNAFVAIILLKVSIHHV